MTEEKKQDLPEEKKEEFIDETNNEAIKEFLKKDGVVEKEPEPDKEEEPKKEEVETIAPKDPEPKEPEIPLEDVVEEVKNKTREEYKEEILKSLNITKEDKKDAEDAGFKFPWEKRGEDRPATWKEQSEGTYEYLKFKEAEEAKIKQESDRKSAEDNEKRLESLNKEWDSQIDYLRKEGHIPDVSPIIKEKLSKGESLSEEDKKDPGIVASAEIFETMYKVSGDREKKGLSPISDVIHIYNRFYKKNKPAGSTAPVSGGKKPIEVEGEEVPYERLHKSSFEDLVG